MRPETELVVNRIKETLDAKKGIDIMSIDISEMTILAECFVVASGATALHARALADAVAEMREAQDGVKPVREEGYEQGHWIVLDYGNVVVHVFHREAREFYNLDKLYSDSEEIVFEGIDEKAAKESEKQ